ncbi:LURP-one-related protein [Dioscorea alata]|uniref:LURP-one-related protein n=1 Tax=Dioscorea alata TaxID=55571 RepID=A0ACB7V2G4_DIOAL|nr:LURP-one-related protein [Dioscorea alata]
MEYNYSPIIGQQYCLSYPTNLAFTTKIAGVRHGELAVIDVNGNPLFWFDGSSKDKKWILVDAISSCTLVSMREKSWSLHERWEVFRGDSTNKKDLLFRVKRSSALKIHPKLEVFLADNTKEEECDFKIKGKYRKRSIMIYKGNKSTVLAQMRKEHNVVKFPLEKDAFGVNISPYTDYAFIAILIAILHKISQESTRLKEELSEEVVSQVVEELVSA